MFICNECKKEYKDRPQYCDCGNDTFEEIITEKIKTDYFKRYDINPCVLIFFLICVITSILILLFFPKIEEKQTTTQNKKIVKPTHREIPNIDSFWINPKPIEEEILEEVEEVIITPPKKQIIKKTIQQPKPAVKQTTSTVVKSQPKPQTTQKPAQTTKTNNISKSLAITNYKIALRQKLFSNLSVSSIQGNGKCGIEFSVDENGKLINRAFTFQSENKSVNDEIYKMLMRTPTYNPPPPEYKGEKIKMTFSFEEGSFEISFVN